MASQVIPLIEGDHIILRDQLPSDIDRFVYWHTHGEWLKFDAPWEGFGETLTPRKEENIRKHFLKRCQVEKSKPRSTAAIVLKDGFRFLGWVGTYVKEGYPKVLYAGINICEDDALNQGLGTETLKLWVEYLFDNSEVHKIGLETWSFNPRMMHVAEKVGFKLEGIEREVLQWQGEWLDLIHNGLLRREWEKQNP